MEKSCLTFLIVITFFYSCDTTEDATPSVPVQDDFNPAEATLLKQGALMGIGHTVSGTVQVFDKDGKKIIFFNPFNSQNGPDLKVYLSKDQNASQYINLGALKSTTGKQSYEVPGNPNIAEYTYVHIWCEQFTVVFARAELQ